MNIYLERFTAQWPIVMLLLGMITAGYLYYFLSAKNKIPNPITTEWFSEEKNKMVLLAYYYMPISGLVSTPIMIATVYLPLSVVFETLTTQAWIVIVAAVAFRRTALRHILYLLIPRWKEVTSEKTSKKGGSDWYGMTLIKSGALLVEAYVGYLTIKEQTMAYALAFGAFVALSPILIPVLLALALLLLELFKAGLKRITWQM